jgi:NADPH-dependent glutamate synthase beta subunit-like oxidoreductase
MDVARSARRLGVPSVTVLALEARDAMPAIVDEVTQALAEGVEIVNEVGVNAFHGTDGAVSEVVIGAARLGRDAEGRIAPIFDTPHTIAIGADAVLLALGQQPDLAALPAELAGPGGLLCTDAGAATPAPHVFAGGDAASRERTVAHAIGAGTRAARAIHGHFTGSVPVAMPGWARPVPDHVVEFAEIRLHAFARAARATRTERLPGSRVTSFVEVVEPLGEAVARAEAARCFSCGGCVGCDVCAAVCPDMAVARLGDGYRMLTEHCKGCGLCARECPRGALHMENES